MATEYKGWTIDWCPNRRSFDATSPNYEPTWLGGWQDDYAHRAEGDTLAEVQAEIDDRITEGA